MASQTRSVDNTVSSQWTNPDNAFTENDQCTAAVADGNQNVYNIIGTPFTIPGGSTIDGIEVKVIRATDDNDYYTIELQDKIPAWKLKTGTFNLAVCAAGVQETLGGPSDIWAGSWDAAHINSSSFQIRLTYVKSGKANGPTVDHIEVVVYYTSVTTYERTVLLDALLKKTGITKSVDLDVALQTAGITKSVDLDVALQTAGITRTTGLSVILGTKWYCTLNGTITDTGGENADERGFDWGVAPATYTFDWTEVGSYGVGSFSHQITDLIPGKTYYFRAKAHNSEGWGYGDEKSVLYVPVETYERTVLLDALLKKTGITKSVDLDVALQTAGITKSVDLDVVIQKIIQKSVDLDTVIKAVGEELGVDLDTLLKAVGVERTVLLDLLVKLRAQKSVDLDVVLQAIYERSVDLDLLIKAEEIQRTVDLDVLIKLRAQRTVLLDLLTKALGVQLSVDLDVALQKLGIEKSVDIDILLQALGITRTVDLDVALQMLAIARSVDLDVLLKLRAQRTVLLDLLVKLRAQKSVDLDVIFKKVGITRTLILDVVLSEEAVEEVIRLPIEGVIPRRRRRRPRPKPELGSLTREIGVTIYEELLKTWPFLLRIWEIDEWTAGLLQLVYDMGSVELEAFTQTIYETEQLTAEFIPYQMLGILEEMEALQIAAGDDQAQLEKLVAKLNKIAKMRRLKRELTGE